MTFRRALLFVFCVAINAEKAYSQMVAWAPHAAPESQGMSELPAQGATNIYAPDKSSLIKFTPDGLSLVSASGMETDLSSFIGSMNLTEFKYSTDSRGLFMNSSLGGLVGDWHTHVYHFESGNAVEIDIYKILSVSGLPKSTPGCEPNIYSIAWLNLSRNLLVLAEVPPSSGCKNMGESRAYMVDLDRKRVEKSYTATEYARSFGKFILGTNSPR